MERLDVAAQILLAVTENDHANPGLVESPIRGAAQQDDDPHS